MIEKMSIAGAIVSVSLSIVAALSEHYMEAAALLMCFCSFMVSFLLAIK